MRRLLLALILLGLGACAPPPIQEDTATRRYIGEYIYAVKDTVEGVTCYRGGNGALSCVVTPLGLLKELAP